MKTKVIGLDVYGTILRTDDADNELPPRNGFREFVEKCQKGNIKLVTTSDVELKIMKLELEMGLGKIGLDLSVFEDFYHLTMNPKNYLPILLERRLSNYELFVMGDRYYIDLSQARKEGCNILLVPEYTQPHDKFNFARIEIP